MSTKTEARESARQPDRVWVRVRGPNPEAPDEGPTVVTDALRGVAIGFTPDGELRVEADVADLDLFERERLTEALHDAIVRVLDGRLGRALH